MIVKGYCDALRDGANELDILFGIFVTRELVGEEYQTDELTSCNHRHCDLRAQSLKHLPVALGKVGKPIALRINRERCHPPREQIDFFRLKSDSVTDCAGQSFGCNDLQLPRLRCVTRDRAAWNRKRAEQRMKRRACHLFEVMRRADFRGKLSERGEVVEHLPVREVHSFSPCKGVPLWAPLLSSQTCVSQPRGAHRGTPLQAKPLLAQPHRKPSTTQFLRCPPFRRETSAPASQTTRDLNRSGLRARLYCVRGSLTQCARVKSICSYF